MSETHEWHKEDLLNTDEQQLPITLRNLRESFYSEQELMGRISNLEIELEEARTSLRAERRHLQRLMTQARRSGFEVWL